MTFAAFISIISGVFQFWDQVTFFVKLLQKTPAEKHDELIKKVEGVFNEKDHNGRPVWD